MKKNRRKIYIIISILLIVIIYFVIFILQNYYIKQKLDNYWYNPKSNKTINQSVVVRCNLNIFKPKIAFVSDHILLNQFPELKIYFYNPKNYFSGEFEKGYVGTTGVKNTTFENLLKMVKEDCSQFQKSKGDRNDKDINWSYGKYEPKPEKTKEEIEALRIEKEEKMKKIKSGEIKRGVLEGFVEYNEDGTIKNEN